jgi:hypothetical protein
MKKAFIPMTLVVVLLTGYSWHRLHQPGRKVPSSRAGEMDMSAAALRHKHGQPSHWRALVLRQQY